MRVGPRPGGLQMKKIIGLLLCLLLLLGTAGCRAEEVHQDLFAMDTVVQLDLYGEGAERAVSSIQAELFRLEQLLSRYRADSDIARLNAAGGSAVTAAPETAQLVAAALELRQRTAGLFDITVAPAMDLWGFSSGEHRVPSDAELAAVLAHIGTAVSVDGTELTLSDPDGALDLGGIAKGYAGDVLADQIRQLGLESALLMLGGNVVLVGSRPNGSDWRVAVRDPQNTADYVGVLSASDCHVVTSGGYERNFQADGITYHHILDPRTGAPSDSGLLSVTVVSDSGLLADALSTALFVMGEEAAIEHWREHRDFELLLITEDGRILASGGIKFEATNGAYTYGTI